MLEKEGLVTNVAKSQGAYGGWGDLSPSLPHSPRRAVSPVAGDGVHSRANLACTVSGVDLCAVQETLQAGLLNTPVTTGGGAGCQSVHRPPVIWHRRRIRGEKQTALLPMLYISPEPAVVGRGGHHEPLPLRGLYFQLI